ncbi:hypothetical protein CBR_g8075 [Chara braunii]|uniref:Uncharacterized protein n=1 Tax=Chara braunii TaxID=69332 RepID=A0A388KL65_CHABU|nr:hypothetical protein CBR_g8075 [Chara braunii]|eukprot:GBG70777.1 hypothetical protein CBR_g8075 [Chara braunii]
MEVSFNLRGMAPCKYSDRVIAFDNRGKFLLLKIVAKRRSEESEEKMLTAPQFAEGPRVHTPIDDATDEPAAAAVSKKRVVEMEGAKSEEEMRTAPDFAKRPRTHMAINAVDEAATAAAAEAASTSKKGAVKIEDNAAKCGKPEWEKTIQQQEVSGLELACREAAVNELREEHAKGLQKLEEDLRLQWMNALNELIKNQVERVQKVEEDIEEKRMKAVNELREEHRERLQKLEDDLKMKCMKGVSE